MRGDLIARLRAAHCMSQCHARDYCGEPGDIHTSTRRVVEEDVFTEIIAALEERERMRAVVEAANHLNDAWCDAINEMDDDNIVPTEQWGAWMKAHRNMNTALDALDALESK